MKTAYFDCFSGAAGDMIVGALIDAGADSNALLRLLDSLGLSGYELAVEKVTRNGIAATHFSVKLTDSPQPHRGFSVIRDIIENGGLSARVTQHAIDIFAALARAEAAVHGTTVEDVHFHEVGAVDAILDVVGAAAALELLDIEQVVCSPIPTGSGTVKCHHGVMPVPAPATAMLLRGVKTTEGLDEVELTTPTGAAVLTTLAEEFRGRPDMTIAAIGHGAGTRDHGALPNVLRVLIGEPCASRGSQHVSVLETNLDDATPEIVAHCMNRLLAAGALDVYAVPIQMKKTRSAVMLGVLSEIGRESEFERIIFEETPTFGIRRHQAERVMLDRCSERVDTNYGPVTIKIGSRQGVRTASPEFEDCRIAAEKHGVAVREVIAAAVAAWRRTVE